MTGEALLSAVRLALDERDGCRVIDDARLAQIIDEAHGDFRQAVYLGAMYKSENDGIALPDGTRLPGHRDYWLTIAQTYRPNLSGTMPRADGR